MRNSSHLAICWYSLEIEYVVDIGMAVAKTDSCQLIMLNLQTYSGRTQFVMILYGHSTVPFSEMREIWIIYWSVLPAKKRIA